MSRSGYVEDLDTADLSFYRGRVANAIKGKRGQAFLRELAIAMDAMEEKVLIVNDLINADGDCCPIGVVCKWRGIDVSNVDPECPDDVGALVGISSTMAAEIEWENDESASCQQSPENRWRRMRMWVERNTFAKEPE